jgi:transposase InsO family protein
VYIVFVVDAGSRFLVGWQAARSLRTDLALDALEMAPCVRRAVSLTAIIHHSDRGVQYLAIRYTERLAEAGVVPAVGSRGDSYDDALAEFLGGLYKAELIRHQDTPGPLARLERRRVLYPRVRGLVPPPPAAQRTGHAPTRRVRSASS